MSDSSNDNAAPHCSPLWRSRHFAEFLGISESKLRSDMSKGLIPKHLYIHVFGGRSVRFIPEAAMAYVLKQSSTEEN